MSLAAQRAFGHARVCAMTSCLLDREGALVLLAGREAATPSAEDLMAGLARDAAILLEAYPDARALLFTLVQRLEIENVKLGWRAMARGISPARWVHLWRPFERLYMAAAVSPERGARNRARPPSKLTREHATEASTLADFVSRLKTTAYGAIAAAVLRAHGDDPTAAELALERWAFVRVGEEADRLPAREAAARALALRVVLEHDIDCLRRAASHGFAPAVASALTARLARELPPGMLERLASWQPADGPLGTRVPRGLVRGAERAADWDALVLALRRERRLACDRALMGPPFTLASPVAFLLLREEDVAGRLAIDRARARTAEAALGRVLSAGRMGA
jgi:hypothetical protein